MRTDYSFDAFISYRRKDGAPAARALRRALLDYRLPKALRGELPERRLSIYLDTMFERADQDFFEDTIKPALAQSRFLILVLTPSLLEPRADGTPNWVRREIAYFRTLPQGRNLLFTCEADSVLPGEIPELRGGFENAERIDAGALRPLRALRNPGRRDDEVLKVAATLLDVPRERMPDLRQEEARRRASRARALSTVLALVAAIMAALFLYARRQSELFRRQLATTYINQARERTDAMDTPAALPWLAAALVVDQPDTRAARLDRIRFGMAARASPVPERIWFASGDGEVRDAMFDPSGRRILSVGSEGVIHDAASGAVLARLPGTDFDDADWSRDGMRIATVGSGGVRIWDAATGKPVTPPMTGDGVRVRFSADGRRVLVARDGAQLFDVATGRLLGSVSRQAEEAYVALAGRAPDDALFIGKPSVANDAFLTVAGGDRTARVWDAGSFVEVGQLVHQANVAYAALSSGGTIIVTGSTEGEIVSWDASTLREIAVSTPMRHDGAFAARFSPAGPTFVTWGGESARLWNAVDGRVLTPPLRHGGLINDAAFSTDGRWIATASDDGTARIWDAASGTPLSPPLRHPAPVARVRFDPGGRLLAVTEPALYLWRMAKDPSLAPLRRAKGVMAVAARRDRLVAASFDGTASVWDRGRRHELVRLRHGSPLHDAELGPDGRRVVTAAEDGTAIVWDSASGRPIGAALRHEDRIVRATFSADGTRIATASHDATARVWDSASGRPVTPPLRHEQLVTTVAFRSDGAFVVTASADRTARVWDARTGQLRARTSHQATVRDVVFSPDGEIVATASNDDTARLWRWRTNEPPVVLRHGGNVRTIRFDPDGDRVVTASDDHTARVWDARSGKPLTPRLEDASALAVAAFNDDGTLVATASDGGTARVWDAATGSFVSPLLHHDGSIADAAFTPDGLWLATGSSDGQTRLWDLRPDQRDLAHLIRLGRLLALESIDETGGPVRTDVRTLRADWEAVGPMR